MKFKFYRRKLTFRRFTYYLLIATIVISCITNGIFAKFTTESDGGDGARVADFGVVVNISGDLFSTAYSNYSEEEVDDGNGGILTQETAISNNPTIYTANENTVSVKAKSETKADGKINNVVAPGTKNDVGINVSVTGTPETDYELSYGIYGFRTVYLSSLSSPYGTIYGLMVEIENGVVTAANYAKLVENGLYISDGGTEYQTYTKITDQAYSENTTYYKLKDKVLVKESYMPIKYYIDGKLLNTSYKNNHVYNSDFPTNFINEGFGFGSHDGAFYQAILGGSKIFHTGEQIDIVFNFSWEWEYHQSGATGAELEWCNACDTILGYIAAGKNVVYAQATSENDLTVNVCNNNLFTSEDVLLDFDIIVNGKIPHYNLNTSFDLSITADQVD